MTAKILIKPTQFIAFFIVCLLTPLTLTAQAGESFNGLIGISAGYDDNVSLSSEEKKSTFLSYRAKLDFRLFPKNPTSEMGIFAEGSYREYLSLEDNYRLRAGGYLIWQMAGGRLTPGIFGDVSAYRDGLNIADEKNGFMVGAKLDWIISARLNLGIQQTWTGSDYGNPTNMFAHHNQPMFRRSFGPPILPTPKFSNIENNRSESLSSTTVRCMIYFLSDLKGEVSGEYVKSDFSVSSESYTGKGAAFSLIWTPIREWEINPTLYWKRFDYDNAPDGTKWHDTEQGIGLNVSRFFKPFEVFVRIDLTDNQSDFETETYRRIITQCGMVWSF